MQRKLQRIKYQKSAPAPSMARRHKTRWQCKAKIRKASLAALHTTNGRAAQSANFYRNNRLVGHLRPKLRPSRRQHAGASRRLLRGEAGAQHRRVHGTRALALQIQSSFSSASRVFVSVASWRAATSPCLTVVRNA